MAFLGCYYSWNGRRIGPVSCEEITRLVEAGMLRPYDEVLQAWQDDGEVRFFRTEASEAADFQEPLLA
jgi:hypothetical protein